MWSRVAVIKTDVSEVHLASIIRVEKSAFLRNVQLLFKSILCRWFSDNTIDTFLRNFDYYKNQRCHILEDGILQVMVWFQYDRTCMGKR
jgi:hypothetical protein